MTKQRVVWIDNAKAFACLLVVIGHLLMSLRKINPYTEITEFIVWFIYLFHMPLFMCISGFLYHKRTKINSLKDYKKFEYKKIINLIVPYITFYSITMCLNMLFSSSVNTPRGMKEWLGIINNPIAPYWFLYALLSIFIFVPIIEKLLNNNKKRVLIVFIVLKILSIFYIPKLYFLKSIMFYGIYFYIGAFIFLKNNNDKKLGISSLIFCYLILSIITYYFKEDINSYLYNLLEIAFATSGTIITILLFKKAKKLKPFNSFKKYTFQIFLMHTIFAAGARIIMYRFNIMNFWIHLIIGLIVSIYIPVLVSIISNKIKFTNFFFYPIKTIEEYKGGK